MKKLHSKFRVGELHRVITFVDNLGKQFSFTAEDVIVVLATLSGWVKRLCEAIKREEVRSELKEKDRLRDVAFRAFFYLLSSYSDYPVDETDESKKTNNAGAHCYDVVKKYSGTASKNYYISTSNVDSLLNDFAKTDVKADLAKIPGAQAFLDRLTERQTEFHKAEIDYVKKRYNRVEAPYKLIKPIIRFMNNIYLPMMSVKAALDEDTYGEFVSELDDFIQKANIMVKNRALVKQTAEDVTQPNDGTAGGETVNSDSSRPGDSSDQGGDSGSGQGGNAGNSGYDDDDSMPQA